MLESLRKHWRRALLLSVFPAILAGLAAMHARSITIKSVRNLDQQILLAAMEHLRGLPQKARLAALDSLVAPLRPSPDREPYVGIAVWEEETQLVAYHTLLANRTWAVVRAEAARDRRFVIRTLDAEGGPVWNVAFFRPELGHDMSPLLFGVLPFLQLADRWTQEVTIGRFMDKVAIIVPLTLLIVFMSLLLVEHWRDGSEERIRRRLEKLQGDLSNEGARADALSEVARAAREEARSAEGKATEARDAVKRLEGDKDTAKELFAQAVEKEKEAFEKLTAAREVEGRSAELNRKCARLELEAATYAAKLARHEGRTRPLFERVVEMILGDRVDWAPKALREAEEINQGLGAGHRRRLWRLLVSASDCRGPEAMAARGFHLSSHASLDMPDVFHEPGNVPFKVYLSWVAQKPRVLAVMGTDSKHLEGSFLSESLASRRG